MHVGHGKQWDDEAHDENVDATGRAKGKGKGKTGDGNGKGKGYIAGMLSFS